jgi:hypothetical protein
MLLRVSGCVLFRSRSVALALRGDVPRRYPRVSRTNNVFDNCASSRLVAPTFREGTVNVLISPIHDLVDDKFGDGFRHRCRCQNDVGADERDNENFEERSFHRHLSSPPKQAH